MKVYDLSIPSIPINDNEKVNFEINLDTNKKPNLRNNLISPTKSNPSSPYNIEDDVHVIFSTGEHNWSEATAKALHRLHDRT